ncbi:CobW family GTP-binding protein [Acinetobacter puyangensis]|nr:GTP-binding protein [Acinetobacter puyangensis]
MMSIPVHIVTGFLGSGKTTLIKRLLLEGDAQNTLVLINELGEIGIDNLLVQTVADNTFLLPSGCMCCTVLDSLKTTLLDMLNKQAQGVIPIFSRVLIETTGLANPASILATIQQDTHLKSRFYLHGLTTVVDTENAIQQSQLHPEWLTQIVAADQILLSKCDRVVDSIQLAVKDKIQQLHSEIVIKNVQDVYCIANLFEEQLLHRQNLNSAVFFKPMDKAKHDLTQTCVIEFEGEIDGLVFGVWLNLLLNKYGEQLLRIKGILKLAGFEQPVLIQGVQHCLYPPEHLEAWSWQAQTSKIVVIARHLDVQQVQRSFQLFMQKLAS